MKDRKITIFIAIVISSLSVAASLFEIIGYSLFKDIKITEKYEYIAVVSTLFLTVLTAFLFTQKTISDNPKTIRISILGDIGVGKTTYLTVLMNELMQNFYVQTVDKSHQKDISTMLENLDSFKKRNFPSRSFAGEISFYRSFVQIDKNDFGINTSKITLEIADISGEDMQQFNMLSKGWHIKTDFFTYTTESNVFLIALDCGRKIEEQISLLKDAIDMIFLKKGKLNNKKSDEPICILFLKSDLINDDNEITEIVNQSTVLLRTCNYHSENVKYFFVSSIGRVTKDVNGYKLPDMTKPENVLEPFFWSLKIIQKNSETSFLNKILRGRG